MSALKYFVFIAQAPEPPSGYHPKFVTIKFCNP